MSRNPLILIHETVVMHFKLPELLDKLTLKESIEFDGSITELKEMIRFKKDRGFRLEWLDDYNFKFVTKFSLGTLRINYMPVEGIKGFAKLTEIESGKTKVEMTTKIRIELYLFTVAFAIIIVAGLLDKEPWPSWVFGLSPFGLIWFWWIYRIQEKGLFKRLKEYIQTDLKNALRQGP